MSVKKGAGLVILVLCRGGVCTFQQPSSSFSVAPLHANNKHSLIYIFSGLSYFDDELGDGVQHEYVAEASLGPFLTTFG